jgi:hypothetical protein
MPRVLFGINAVLAVFAVGLSLTLNITGYYVDTMDPSKPVSDNGPGGNDTVLERLLDWSTYFTILSNMVVLIVMVTLILRLEPFARQDRVGGVWRTLGPHPDLT